MERAIAQWTGHDVTIQGGSNIIFWPQPRIEVERLTVSKAGPEGVRVLSRTQKLSAEFSLYHALSGAAVFEDFRLVNPEIFVVRDANGRLDWANDGQLSAATRNVAASRSQNALDPALDVTVGDIAIESGVIEISDVSSGDTWRVTDINGEIEWPRLSASASAEVTAQVQGQRVQIAASSPQPLLLLAGSTAAFDGSIASPLLTGRFAGFANLADYGFVSGKLELSAPDVPALAGWAGLQAAQMAPLEQLSLTAQLLTTEEAVRFDQMQLSVNGSVGSGLLEFSLPASGSPRIGGTLAFDRLNLTDVTTAIAAAQAEGEDDSLAAQLDLDIRVSGKQATAGALVLVDTAVSIMTRTDEARIDIVDGTAAGGRVTGQIMGNGRSLRSGGTVRLSVRDADLPVLWQQLGLIGPLPIARGTIGLDLSFPGTVSWPSLASVDGLLRITSGPGLFPEMDPSVLLQRVGSHNYTTLRNPSGKGFEYQRLELVARLANGVAQVETAIVEGAGGATTLTGIVSYLDGGLALSADITASSGTAPPQRLFIGGTWPDPMAIEIP